MPIFKARLFRAMKDLTNITQFAYSWLESGGFRIRKNRTLVVKKRVKSRVRQAALSFVNIPEQLSLHDRKQKSARHSSPLINGLPSFRASSRPG